MGKQWKTDAEEDKFLKKLIKQGKVHKHTKPSTLKKDYPSVFGDFTISVIRNHLNLLKRAILMVSLLNRIIFILVDDTNGSGSEVDEETEYDLKEGQESETSKCDINVGTGCVILSHQNYPVVCQTFKDPETEYEKVLLVVSLPGGAENVKVKLNDDGLVVVIKYSWAKAMYDVKDIFKKQFSLKTFHAYHPMVQCYKSGLELVRKKIDMAPDSTMTVNLPVKVQTAENAWKKWGVKRDDGTQLLLAEFTGYVKEYIKKSADETVIFDY